MKKKDSQNIPLLVLGYDFSRASTRWRSALPLSKIEKQELFANLQENKLADGIVFLDTCNRNEVIVSSPKPDWVGELLRANLINRLKEKFQDEYVPEPFLFVGKDAARHIFRVSSGLESFVQGEQQIAGQLNTAFMEARKYGRSDTVLNRLSTLSGKAARDTAGLGVFKRAVRGVHDLSVKYLLQNFPEPKKYVVTVLGYGEIGRLTVDSLRHHTNWKVHLVNRTVPNIKEDEQKNNSKNKQEKIYPLEQLTNMLAQSDMAIVCSGAPTPLVTKKTLEKLTNNILLVDLGIPSQISQDVEELPLVEVANLDVLMQTQIPHLRNEENLEKVESVISSVVFEFMHSVHVKEMAPILQSAQDTHTKYIQEIIPQVLREEFPELDENLRSRLLFRLRGLVRDYTNAMIKSVHTQVHKKVD